MQNLYTKNLDDVIRNNFSCTHISWLKSCTCYSCIVFLIICFYRIPRFQLWLELLFRRNTMNYSRRTPAMNTVRSDCLLLSYHFLQIKVCFVIYKSFFQISFQTLKLTSTHVSWTLMLIIIKDIQIIVVCYTLVVF